MLSLLSLSGKNPLSGPDICITFEQMLSGAGVGFVHIQDRFLVGGFLFI